MWEEEEWGREGGGWGAGGADSKRAEEKGGNELQVNHFLIQYVAMKNFPSFFMIKDHISISSDTGDFHSTRVDTWEEKKNQSKNNNPCCSLK